MKRVVPLGNSEQRDALSPGSPGFETIPDRPTARYPVHLSQPHVLFQERLQLNTDYFTQVRLAVPNTSFLKVSVEQPVCASLISETTLEEAAFPVK